MELLPVTAMASDRFDTTALAQTPGRIVAYFIACCAAWLAARPYEGITYDGQLYTLQALATLRPHPLADDIFLRFGSQNDFTLFPRVVAPLIGLFGPETAAALVTIASALMLLAGGWLLARRLSSPGLAWLSLGLLITVPGWYGAASVFRYDEMYLTARVPAEALSVFALVLACGNRWWPAALFILIALFTHPVMAVPAAGVLALLAIDRHSARLLGGWTTTLVAVAGAVLLIAAAAILAPEKTTTHELWMQTLRTRTVYAFMQEWPAADWIQNALGLATLAVAAKSLESRIGQRLAHLALLVGITGLALAWLASLSRHFDLLLLAQSWRWPWLGRFVAVAMLPAIVVSLWQAGRAGRAAAMLLASAWALSDYSGGLVAIAAAAVWFGRARLQPPRDATALKGAVVVVCAALVVLVVLAIQALPVNLDTNRGPIWVQRFVDVAGLAGPPVLLIAAAWWLAFARRSRFGVALVAATATTALAGQLAYQYSRLAEPRYSAAMRAGFATWRDAIPQSAEVLWWEDPAAAWTLLERKSFLSVSQSAGLMYSPDAIAEFIRRSNVLSPLVSPGYWTRGRRIDGEDFPKTLSSSILRSICQEPTLGYVVGTVPLDGYRLRAEWPARKQYVYLYDCAAFRQGTPE
jgi:hypothetical protein